MIHVGRIPEHEVERLGRRDQASYYYKINYQIELTFILNEIRYVLIFKGKKYDAVEVKYR
jgi:hypothetical protein